MKKIGSGNLSSVYVEKHAETQRLVAIKLFFPKYYSLKYKFECVE